MRIWIIWVTLCRHIVIPRCLRYKGGTISLLHAKTSSIWSMLIKSLLSDFFFERYLMFNTYLALGIVLTITLTELKLLLLVLLLTWRWSIHHALKRGNHITHLLHLRVVVHLLLREILTLLFYVLINSWYWECWRKCTSVLVPLLVRHKGICLSILLLLKRLELLSRHGRHWVSQDIASLHTNVLSLILLRSLCINWTLRCSSTRLLSLQLVSFLALLLF